MQIEYVVKKVH